MYMGLAKAERIHLWDFSKNKKTRQNDREGKVGMHLAGDQKPLKYSENLTETQNEIKKLIKNPKTSL
jgi:hypothetical protein